jgi:RND family efflux transporter MFP subunit
VENRLLETKKCKGLLRDDGGPAPAQGELVPPYNGAVFSVCAALSICAAMVGCQPVVQQLPEARPPEVIVCLPVSDEITDHEDFTGQTQAVKTVNILARVSGYLDEVFFKDGDEVDKGTLLFEIDPRPYQNMVDHSLAQVESSEAALRLARQNNVRAIKLHTDSPKSITQQDVDSFQAAEDQAVAALDTAKATLATNQLNLEFTKVTAPITGRLSRRMVDPGNLVKADETIVTRIVTEQPMYVYFDLNERTMLRLRRLVKKGKTASMETTDIPVLMGLHDEEGTFPHGGTINFEDNQLDTATGTLRVRAVFPNADRLLKPGFFVKVRVPIGEAKTELLVPEQALGTDQGQKFVFVVVEKTDDDGKKMNEVEYRPVKAGKLRDGMRVISDGLSANDRVVVSGLQRIRAGVTVEIKASQAEQPETAAKTEGGRMKDEG